MPNREELERAAALMERHAVRIGGEYENDWKGPRYQNEVMEEALGPSLREQLGRSKTVTAEELAVAAFRPGPSDGRPGNVREVFEKQANDMVNSPSHYNQGVTESIDVIRQSLGAEGFKAFCHGNAIKYVHRARFKGTEDTDLKKAIWYLRMAVGDDPRRGPR